MCWGNLEISYKDKGMYAEKSCETSTDNCSYLII